MFTPRLPPQYTTTLYDADIPYDSDIRYDWVVPILPTYTTRPVVTSTFTPRVWPTDDRIWNNATDTWDNTLRTWDWAIIPTWTTRITP